MADLLTFQHRPVELLRAPPDATKITEHPLINSLLWTRQIRSAQELDYRLQNLIPFDHLKSVQSAANFLVQALMMQLKVVILGDFDSDGMTSTALMLLGLRALGFKQVDYFIPNRFEHGYGLAPQAVALVLKKRPELVITVDNGIVGFQGVQQLKAANVRVLITDHHLSETQLPNADAVVNPNQTGDTFESKALAGVGVAFYVLLALRAELRKQGWFKVRKEPNLAQFLDLVAIGTMADASYLDYNNRILVMNGLRRMQQGQMQLGLLAVLNTARLDYHQITSEDLVFGIAPRLNAAGRLSDANIVVELLTTPNQLRASQLAQKLEQLNDERRTLSQEMEQQAIVQLSASKSALPAAITLYQPNWHQGISGIVASRIKEKFERPVVIFAKNREGYLKGSARSVANLNIRDSFQQIKQKHPQLIEAFGGHAMAAGITLRPEALSDFISVWNQVVLEKTSKLDVISKPWQLDDYLDPSYLTLETARQLSQLGPWGNGFSEPTFFAPFKVQQVSSIGRHHYRLNLIMLEANVRPFEAILFNASSEQEALLRPQSILKAIFHLNISNYNNQSRLQLVLNQFESDAA